MKNLFLIISLLFTSLSAAAQSDSLSLENPQKIKIAEVEQTATPLAADMLVEATWDSANTAYINGDYAKAIELYTSITEQGLSSDKLYFNLGNAYYKSEDMARAILNYQKALLITPNDADILYNLGVAQSQIRDQIEEIPEFFIRKWSRSIAQTFNCTGWSIISLVALSLILSALILFLLAGSIKLRKVGFGVGLFAAFILLISLHYALEERREILNHNKAVIMSQSIAIKSSPDRSSTDLFVLHSGTTVKILREIDGWFEVVIADGKSGWIESRRVEQI
ncbi:MAG: tetratricopeptide repeat protein [Rikenellaceae bacterium]